jgi:CRISPR-associated protein Csx14
MSSEATVRGVRPPKVLRCCTNVEKRRSFGAGVASHDTLIATLGSEPQIVTIALDRLLAMEYRIRDVRVIHTAAPPVQQALAAVTAEFDSGSYPGLELDAVSIEDHGRALDDFRTETDVAALIRTCYREVRRAKRDGRVVHLCVAGGRKVMAVAGMVVAQLLFGPNDRVWHLLSEGWVPGAGRRMHLPPEQVWLIDVPVLRWADSQAVLMAIAELDDPIEALRRYEEALRSQRMSRRREFVERWLTGAEREVVRLACQGLDNAGIASSLRKGERTVANQLTSVYAKLSDWLGWPTREPDRSVLIAEFAPYFAVEQAVSRRNEVPSSV